MRFSHDSLTKKKKTFFQFFTVDVPSFNPSPTHRPLQPAAVHQLLDAAADRGFLHGLQVDPRGLAERVGQPRRLWFFWGHRTMGYKDPPCDFDGKTQENVEFGPCSSIFHSYIELPKGISGISLFLFLLEDMVR